MPTSPADTEEFRRQAVDRTAAEKLTVGETARRLGVDPATLRKWVKKYRPTPAAPVATPSVEQDLRRLREQNRQLKVERDVLKKRLIT